MVFTEQILLVGRFLILAQDKEKPMAVRTANILAAKGIYNLFDFCMYMVADVILAVADAIRTVRNLDIHICRK